MSPALGSAPQGPASGQISFASPRWKDAGAGPAPGQARPSPSVPDVSQVPPPASSSPGSPLGSHPLASSPSALWGG